MTEMIVNFKMQPRLFKPMPTPNRIDPRAFFGALIGAPILVALLSFWAFLIPVFAIPFGGPIYLILGTPALLWALSYKNWSPAEFAVFGASVFSVAAGIVLVGAAYLERDPEVLGLVWLILLGALFAAAWSNAFAHLYNKFKRV